MVFAVFLIVSCGAAVQRPPGDKGGARAVVRVAVESEEPLDRLRCGLRGRVRGRSGCRGRAAAFLAAVVVVVGVLRFVITSAELVSHPVHPIAVCLALVMIHSEHAETVFSSRATCSSSARTIGRSAVFSQPTFLVVFVPPPDAAAYVCLIVDAFSRLIVGWPVAAHMRTSMVLDALEMARRSRGTQLDGPALHSDAG